MNFLKSYLDEFIQTNVQDQERNAQWKLAQQWKPPINLCIKVNFDGALNLQTNEGGIGVVIRNDKGAVTGAYAGKISDTGNPFMVEAAAAAIFALEFAQQM